MEFRGLPDEMVLHITSFLSLPDAAHFGMSSKLLYSLTLYNSDFWHHLFQTYFAAPCETDDPKAEFRATWKRVAFQFLYWRLLRTESRVVIINKDHLKFGGCAVQLFPDGVIRISSDFVTESTRDMVHFTLEDEPAPLYTDIPEAWIKTMPRGFRFHDFRVRLRTISDEIHLLIYHPRCNTRIDVNSHSVAWLTLRQPAVDVPADTKFEYREKTLFPSQCISDCLSDADGWNGSACNETDRRPGRESPPLEFPAIASNWPDSEVPQPRR
eukprot:TRINITY_DN6323_c0_g2_i1.p1 TRINITY_DN6323_c0_g2~~TRINITY_DN6323_c0_g2_i1.p1  ORF type:complete len:269 (+),score=29.72 TRINITY_DN6323_c0_g2_i1:39-845(+)